MFNVLESLKIFCWENGFEYLADNFIEEEYIQEWLDAQELEWQSMAMTLQNVTWFNDPYYLIDGYGHLRNVSYDDVKCLFHDLLREIQLDENNEAFELLKEMLEDDFDELMLL